MKLQNALLAGNKIIGKKCKMGILEAESITLPDGMN
jgi:hypothetical protein